MYFRENQVEVRETSKDFYILGISVREQPLQEITADLPKYLILHHRPRFNSFVLKSGHNHWIRRYRTDGKDDETRRPVILANLHIANNV